MSESIPLEESEGGRCGFQIDAVPSPRRKKPVLMVIVVTFIIITTTFWVNLFCTHANIAKLKSATMKQEQISKLNQILITLELEYMETIKNHIPSDERNSDSLLKLHNATKTSALQTFDTAAEINTEVTQVYKEQLSRKLDKLFDTIQQEHAIKMEIGAHSESARAESAKLLVRMLAQKYFQTLERKMYGMESMSELENFSEPARQIILKEFEETVTLPLNSLLYYNLKTELENELEQVYLGLESEDEDWNVKITKAYQEVQKVYSEEYKQAVLKYKGTDLIYPEISFEFHEKVADIAISKCVRQKLIPTSTRILFESKSLLDQAYHKKITDHAVIGIDFGDLEARAAVYFRGKIQTIPHLDRSGEIYNSTACYVGVSTYDGYVGQCAQKILVSSLQPSPIVYGMKLIIQIWDDNSYDKDDFDLTFHTHYNDEGPIVSGVGFRYPIKFVISKLFSKIRDNAEAFVGHPVKRCVVTFSDGYFKHAHQKQVLSNAAKMAGFTLVTLLEEHTAAALTLQHVNGVWNETKAVAHLDFTEFNWTVGIVKGYRDNFKYQRRVRNSDGGLRLKENLMEYSIRKFLEVESLPPSTTFLLGADGKIRLQRLLASCVKAVKSLSAVENTTVFVSEFFEGKSLAVNITRDEFEKLNDEYFNKINEMMTSVLRSIKRRSGKFEAILTGDDSRIPKVRQNVGNYFPANYLDISGVPPQHNVAYGAAVKGAMLAADAIKASKSN